MYNFKFFFKYLILISVKIFVFYFINLHYMCKYSLLIGANVGPYLNWYWIISKRPSWI